VSRSTGEHPDETFGMFAVLGHHFRHDCRRMAIAVVCEKQDD